MNALGGVFSLLYYFIRCYTAFTDMSDKDVAGSNHVSKRGTLFTTVVIQVDSNVDSVLGHWHKKDILERLAHSLCLVIRQPFLKQGREGVPVNNLI